MISSEATFSNGSLATFQVQAELCLLHLDSYNNSLGETDKYLIVLAMICCILCIFGLFLAHGILLYEKYGLHNGNRHLTDMVIILIAYESASVGLSISSFSVNNITENSRSELADLGFH